MDTNDPARHELVAGDDLDAVLDDFAERRFERCRMVVDNSVQLGDWEREPAEGADSVALTSASWAQLAQPF